MAKLLIVEDTPAALTEIANLLAQRGHEVLTAVDVASACAQLARVDDNPIAIILCDHQLDYQTAGALSGEEVYRYARSHYHPETPFIASSSIMDLWTKFQIKLGAPPNFYPVPKVSGHWDKKVIPSLVESLLELY